MKTNSLVKIISFKGEGTNHGCVELRLDDECKNGIADFSATYIEYDNHERIAGGCLSMDNPVLKKIPKEYLDLAKRIARLHLCDLYGRPGAYVSNPLYFLENRNKKAFMEVCRMSEEEYNEAKSLVYDKFTMYAWLRSRNIIERWKQEADEATKMLEQACGQEFEFVPTRPDYDGAPWKEKYEQEPPLLDKKKAKKEKDLALKNAMKKKISERHERYKKEFDKLNLQLQVDNHIAEILSKKRVQSKIGIVMNVMDAYIFYDHRPQVVFNWCGSRHATFSDLMVFFKELEKSDFFKQKCISFAVAVGTKHFDLVTVTDNEEQKALDWLRDNNYLIDK